ncbi:hypothetical protein [Mucilaginibacter terrae]|uniref:Glycoside hydrolase n=1 Tax=Mucilaginibacter terrae TaxID=1955052 RepID=A0ABU3GRK5_9SPHI|nr:hypothetical protein [Mucilaginibacter terrae]MDT3402418.1 hypothetical protein [Mucilaginibacter terrae]
MNTKMINSFALAVCGVLFWFIMADINGKWTSVIEYNGNLVPLAFNFKTESDKLTGTTETPLGVSNITDGKIDKDMISFKLDLNGSTAACTGRTFADSINLKINYQGADFLATLKRSNAQ